MTGPENVFLGVSMEEKNNTKKNKTKNKKKKQLLNNFHHQSNQYQPSIQFYVSYIPYYTNLPLILASKILFGHRCRRAKSDFFFLYCTLVYMYNYFWSSKHLPQFARISRDTIDVQMVSFFFAGCLLFSWTRFEKVCSDLGRQVFSFFILKISFRIIYHNTMSMQTSAILFISLFI